MKSWEGGYKQKVPTYTARGLRKMEKEKGDVYHKPWYIQNCERTPCNVWSDRRQGKAPGLHWHCVYPHCPSRGLLGSGFQFACSKIKEIKRHVQAHENHEEKALLRTREVWEHIISSSTAVNRVDKTNNMTQLRRDVLTHGEVPTATINEWRSRIYIGKVGATGEALGASLERVGTLPLFAPSSLELHTHDPRTQKPKPGHTIRFNPLEENDEVWYAVCCSDFSHQPVLSEHGEACTVRWFEKRHSTEWNGSPATFYELTNIRQTQLFTWMADWGHLLIHDQETGLFVDTLVEVEEDGDEPPPQMNPKWYDDEVRAQPMLTTPTREQLWMCKMLFPEKLLYYVDENGVPKMPESCRKQHGDQECKWDTPWDREFLHLPLNTPTGPVFIRPVRYYCVTHKSTVTAGGRKNAMGKGGEQQHGQAERSEVTNPYSLNLPYYRLYDMRYAPEIITQLQSSYVDTLCIAACRRRILDQWLSTTLVQITALKRLTVTKGFDPVNLKQASNLVLALQDFLPSVQSITRLMLTVFQKLVEPQIPAYDAAAAAFDGQLVKVDGTFKAASVIQVNEYDPNVTSRRKTVYKRVGGCILVALGLEGICLATPRLVPSESNESISKLLMYILRNRRSVLGSLSAPAGFSTDSLRQQKKMLLDVVNLVYPEMCGAVQQSENPGNQYLLLQDIVHRLWYFTKKVATKTHPDYHAYTQATRGIFQQLRTPYVDNEQEMKRRVDEWNESWAMLCEGPDIHVPSSRNVLNNHVKRGILASDRSSQTDDYVALKFLEKLGNAAMDNNGMGMYIPRTVLIQSARRLLMPRLTIQNVFPDHGYRTGENFLEHLRGVNIFFRTLRSLSAHQSDHTIVRRLAQQDRPRKRPRGVNESRPEDVAVITGISDREELVAECISSCSEQVVSNITFYEYSLIYLCHVSVLAFWCDLSILQRTSHHTLTFTHKLHPD